MLHHLTDSTIWTWLTALSIVNWALGFITGSLPTIIILLSLFYWVCMLWQTITGKKISNTRWARFLSGKGFTKPQVSQEDNR